MGIVVLLAGCLDQLRPEGEESITIRNLEPQTVEVIVRIQTQEGGFVVFFEDVVLETGAARQYVAAMRPGGHVVYVTTSTRIDEVFPIEVPTRGDAHFELTLARGSASLKQT